jgi:hypothetical protein
MDFIKYYLFDSGVEMEFPVIVRFAFGFEAMNPEGVNIARDEAVQIDRSLAALADEILLSSSSTTGPRSKGSVTKT